MLILFLNFRSLPQSPSELRQRRRILGSIVEIGRSPKIVDQATIGLVGTMSMVHDAGIPSWMLFVLRWAPAFLTLILNCKVLFLFQIFMWKCWWLSANVQFHTSTYWEIWQRVLSLEQVDNLKPCVSVAMLCPMGWMLCNFSWNPWHVQDDLFASWPWLRFVLSFFVIRSEGRSASNSTITSMILKDISKSSHQTYGSYWHVLEISHLVLC